MESHSTDTQGKLAGQWAFRPSLICNLTLSLLSCVSMSWEKSTSGEPFPTGAVLLYSGVLVTEVTGFTATAGVRGQIESK